MQRKKGWFRYAVMLFLVLAAGVIYSCGSQKTDQEILLETSGVWDDQEMEASLESSSGDLIYVHVCGAVMKPGVYELPAGSRIYQAIEEAGGYAEDVYEPGMNLAEILVDGQQVNVLTDALQESLLEVQSMEEDGLVDLNTANQETLMTLPGIGEVKADAILSYREEHGDFQSIEELKNVPGIKEAAYDALKDLIVVR